MNFFQTHKRLITIVAIALIVIGLAYYYTLGAGSGDKEEKEDAGTKASPAAPPAPAAAPKPAPVGSFPLRYGKQSEYTARLQRRLNQSLEAAKARNLAGFAAIAPLKDDGVLGSNTAAMIKRFFPGIGSSVAVSQTVSESQYNTMIASKTSTAATDAARAEAAKSWLSW